MGIIEGFHRNTPPPSSMDGFCHGKSQSRNGWWLGVPLWLRKPPYRDCSLRWAMELLGWFRAYRCLYHMPFKKWILPEMGVPPNWWFIQFIQENPEIGWERLGYPYFKKPPYLNKRWEIREYHGKTMAFSGERSGRDLVISSVGPRVTMDFRRLHRDMCYIGIIMQHLWDNMGESWDKYWDNMG